jgi:hypothetical protein
VKTGEDCDVMNENENFQWTSDLGYGHGMAEVWKGVEGWERTGVENRNRCGLEIIRVAEESTRGPVKTRTSLEVIKKLGIGPIISIL